MARYLVDVASRVHSPIPLVVGRPLVVLFYTVSSRRSTSQLLIRLLENRRDGQREFHDPFRYVNH